MCLNTLTKVYETPDPTEREGWKLLERSWCGLTTPFKMYRVKQGEWNVAFIDYPITAISGERYQCGFHVFATKEAAEWALEWLRKDASDCDEQLYDHTKVVKVKVRNVTAEGPDATSIQSEWIEANLHTLVAKEMWVDETV